MPLENSYFCPLSKKIFFDPVSLPCCNGNFEKEFLQDKLDEKLNCPNCDSPVTSENQIQPATEIKTAVSLAIQNGELLSKDQYLPNYVIFNLFTNNNLVMPLSQIENLVKFQDSERKYNYILNDNITPKKDKLILYALKVYPELMAYFLWQAMQTSCLGNVIQQLIDLDAFDEITLNQSISKKIGEQHEVYIYTVTYLLLANAEGRKKLEETPKLRLLFRHLTEEHLKQFVHKNTHKGILYYLLINEEAGQKILKENQKLQKIMNETSIQELLQSTRIIDGPSKGLFLWDLYKPLLPNLPASFSR